MRLATRVEGCTEIVTGPAVRASRRATHSRPCWSHAAADPAAVLARRSEFVEYLSRCGAGPDDAAAAVTALDDLLCDMPAGPVLVTLGRGERGRASLAVDSLSPRLARRTHAVDLPFETRCTCDADVQRVDAERAFASMQLGCWIERRAARVASLAVIAMHAHAPAGTVPVVGAAELTRRVAALGNALRFGVFELWRHDVHCSMVMLRARGYDLDEVRATWQAVWSIVRQRAPSVLRGLVAPLATGLDEIDDAAEEPSYLKSAEAASFFRSFEERPGPREIVAGLRGAGMTTERLFLECFTPLQRESGRLWQYGRMSVEEEHRRSAIVNALIHQTALPDRTAPAAGSVLLLCAPGEQHDIGLKMIAQLARLDGWDVVLPGRAQTAEQIYVMVLDRRPDVLVLSASLTASVCALVPLIARVKSDPRCAGTAIVVGGAPFVRFPQLARIVGADATAPDAAAAMALLPELRAGRRPESTTRDPAALNASQLESVVRAGSWSFDHMSGTCSWSPGLYELLDVDSATLAPSYAALMDLVEPGERETIAAAWRTAHAEHEPFELTHRVQLANGLVKIVLQRAQTTYDSAGNALETVGMLVDITKEQLTRRKLDAATAKLMAIWEHVPDALALLDSSDGALVEVNPQAETIVGQAQAELAGKRFTELFPSAHRKRTMALFARVARTPAHNVQSVLRNGVPVEISTSGTFRVGPREMTLASFRDISLRKELEKRASRLTATLAVMVRANAAIVHASTIDDLPQLVCNAIVGDRYLGASVAEPGAANEPARVVATAGPRRYFEGLALGWDPQESRGRGPFGVAVRSGRPVVALASDPIAAPWRERALAAGIRGVIALPLRDTPGAPVLGVYIGDDDGFSAPEIALFESLADDVALGLRALRERRFHEEAAVAERARAQEVELALTGALAAVGAALEQRDPYTAGHEVRVRDLCSAIARELGLEDDLTRGLCIAASVHDIGKISIPAEILTKPTRLDEIEFAFVRQHPQTGYDILRNIPFRWPIAEIVLQHHEYLDGTGYPRALTAGQILLEARVLAVADIVDSMSSFRPFHRAFGMESVVGEITRIARNRLDPDVVAACTRVLKRGEFQPATGMHPDRS